MPRLNRIFIFLILIFFSFSFSGQAESLPDELLSAKEAQKLIKDENKNLVILDVRTPKEFAEGHIPHAQNIDFFGPVFERDINKLDRETLVLVYCQTGRRSEAAAQLLRKADFKKVYDLKGGINAWKKADLPVVEEGEK